MAEPDIAATARTLVSLGAKDVGATVRPFEIDETGAATAAGPRTLPPERCRRCAMWETAGPILSSDGSGPRTTDLAKPESARTLVHVRAVFAITLALTLALSSSFACAQQAPPPAEASNSERSEPEIYEQSWFWISIVAIATGVTLAVVVDVTTDDPAPARVGLTVRF